VSLKPELGADRAVDGGHVEPIEPADALTQAQLRAVAI
jgi:hypothetical protein